MRDRGMIKWQPFDSLTSSKQMVQHIMNEKNKVSKPVLSQEQMQEIEERICEGFHSQIPLRIIYYFKGRYQVKQDLLILDILPGQKKILFEDHSSLYFDQIIRVTSN
ncbi:MAG: YolD-like family protein [Bacilli bacterium]|nr:YolD-like family protein [Bacilli bacterium]